VLDRGLRYTNGIAFGPDGRLYVAETLSGDIFAYDLGETFRGDNTLGTA
jgi:gluconolactonase